MGDDDQRLGHGVELGHQDDEDQTQGDDHRLHHELTRLLLHILLARELDGGAFRARKPGQRPADHADDFVGVVPGEHVGGDGDDPPVIDPLDTGIAGLVGYSGHGRQGNLKRRRVPFPRGDRHLLAEKQADVATVFFREPELDGILFVPFSELRYLRPVDGRTQAHPDLGGVDAQLVGLFPVNEEHQLGFIDLHAGLELFDAGNVEGFDEVYEP